MNSGKLILCVFLLAVCSRVAVSQTLPFKKIDRKSKNIFLFLSPDAEKLTKKLTAGYTTDEEKVRAIYVWITSNISYDVSRFKRGVTSHNAIETTLRKRKALCAEYSELFVAMCNYAGVEATPIIGYAKGLGTYENQKYYAPNHQWCMVKLNGEWKLIDPVYASGYIRFKAGFKDYMRWISPIPRVPVAHSKMKFKRKRNDYYYLTPPANFVLDHLPLEKMYQLLPNPVDAGTFEKDTQSINHFLRNTSPYFNFYQPLAAYQGLTPIPQFIWAADSSYTSNNRNRVNQSLYLAMAAVIKTDESGARDKHTKDFETDTLLIKSADSLATISDSLTGLAKTLLEEERNEKHLLNSDRKNRAHAEIKQVTGTINKMNAYFSVTSLKFNYLRKHEDATQRALTDVLNYYRHLDFPFTKQKLATDTNTLNLVMENNKKLIQKDLDSISVKLAQLHTLFKELDTLWFDTIATWNKEFTLLNQELFSLSCEIANARRNYESSLSPHLLAKIKQRDELIQQMNLILQRKKETDKIQKGTEALMKQYLKNIKEYTKTIRRKLIENIKMGQSPNNTYAYTRALTDYEKALDIYASRYQRLRIFVIGELNWCSKNRHLNDKLSYVLFCESWFESKRYHLYNTLFNNYRKGVGQNLVTVQRFNRQTKRICKQAMENAARQQKLKSGTR